MPHLNVIDIEGNPFAQCLVVCLNREGNEIPEADGKLLSNEIGEYLQRHKGKFEDIFVFCHGWQGDAPGAMAQYTDWIGAMRASRVNQAASYGLSEKYEALVIGLHWPSRPLGVEEFENAISAPLESNALIRLCAELVVNSPEALNAYKELGGMATALEGGALDSLKVPISKIISEIQKKVDEWHKNARGAGRSSLTKTSELLEKISKIGGDPPSRDSIIARVINSLSFYQMKERAHTVGSSGAKAVLTSLLSSKEPETGLHVMGHSFGCIVASAMVSSLPSGVCVDSLSLIQGALSIWSFSKASTSMPVAGQYSDVIEKVAGPIITTQSAKDTAVGVAYPLAVSTLDDERYNMRSVFGDYSAVGTNGIRGFGIPICDLEMMPADGKYFFKPQTVYNLRSDMAICAGGPPSGAHCDIAKPEVANAVWQAALVKRSKKGRQSTVSI